MTTTIDTYALLQVQRSLPRKRHLHVLDLCAGSGVQGLHAASLMSAASLSLVDLNPRALRFAKANILLNNVRRVHTYHGHLYKALPRDCSRPSGCRKFDLILANPPYVPSMGPGQMFVAGGPRGEDVTEAILRGASEVLAPNGRLLLVANLANVDRNYIGKLQTEFPDSNGCGDFLPGLVLVISVASVQYFIQHFSLLILTLSLALGLTIIAGVPKGVLRWLTTTLAGGFLSLASYVDVVDQPLKWDMPPAMASISVSSMEAPAVGASPAAWKGETLSVVLPCAYEGEYASRTVESVWRHTKKNRLKEIIVVDDGSVPKLVLDLPEPLRVTSNSGPSLRGSDVPQVRLLRHEKTMGLIAAKKTGGDAAAGDVVVFFDCHVKPRDGWDDAFLKQMHRAGDHRTIVVPTITALNPDTWEENAGAASTACYMMWNADFTWLVQPGRDVAQGAFVAHMWRDPNNPKTRLKYTMRTEDVMRNKARAVAAWLGPFSNKTFSTFPEYEAFFDGENSIGDLSNFGRLKKELQCADFSSYIQRFSYLFLDGGLIPEKIFQLQEESSGLCLEREVQDARSHNIVLAPCVNVKGNKGVLETQIWHLANRDHSQEDAPCCSGLMNWNFLQCLSASSTSGPARTEECDVSGHNAAQHFRIAEEGKNGPLLWRDGHSCLAPSILEQGPKSRYQLELDRCAVKVEQWKEGIRLQFEKDGQPFCVTVSLLPQKWRRMCS
eukprot:symbB.v1.2.007895.t1/scaffold489.1/size197246/13